MWTLAEERSYAVMAGCTMITCRACTVVNVLTAVITRPTVHTNAVIAAMSVVTRASILTCVGHQLALVYIFCAVLT